MTKQHIEETAERFFAVFCHDEKLPGFRLRVDREVGELTMLVEETTLPERVLSPHAQRVERHEHLWLTQDQVDWLHATLGRLTTTQPLGVWTDGTDTVVAADLLDVVRVIVDHAGSFESNLDKWRRRDDTELLTMDSGDNPFADDAVDGKLTLTAAQWVAKNGRGLLCSSEY